MSRETHIVFSHRDFEHADFRGARLDQFSAEACTFTNCRFDDAKMDFASFGAGRGFSQYVGCSFDNASIRMGPGGDAQFVGCTFENTSVENWFCFGVELINCTFSGRLRKVVFNGAVPHDKRAQFGRKSNRFIDNDFARAKLIDVSFRSGIDLTQQKLPVGEEYVYIQDAPIAVRRARLSFNSWEDLDEKKRASSVLSVMEEDVAAGQTQLLIRAEDYPRLARPAIRALLAAACEE